MQFYVYMYEREGCPIYVGMGHANRDVSHWKTVKRGKGLKNPHFCNILKKMLREEAFPTIRRVAEGLTVDEAKAEEKRLIKEIGRSDLGRGPLTNMTDGGDGYVGWSDEARKKLSEKKRGKIAVRDALGNMFHVAKDDPGWMSGKLVGINAGKKTATGSMTGLVQAKTLDGVAVRVHKDDPRWVSGELVGINAGKRVSSETKEKMAAAQKGKSKPKPEGFREKMRLVALAREAKKRGQPTV